MKKFFITFFTICISVALIGVVVYCQKINIEEASKETGEEERNYKDVIPEKDYLYYFYQLSDTEKVIYNKILEKVKQGEIKITFENVNTDEYSGCVKKAIRAMCYDYPELYWIYVNYQMLKNTYPNGIGSVEVTVSTINVDYSEQAQLLLENKVAEIADLCNVYESNYEKALFVHDYIVKNCEYDVAGLEENEGVYSAHTAYGCLVEGKAVCLGYSNAYKIILDKLNIPCVLVIGYGTSSIGHAWNCIELNGDFYNVDVTWDDPVYSAILNENADDVVDYEAVNHNFFCVADEILFKDHTVDMDEGLQVPTCNGDKYDYYKINGLYLEKYDFEEAKNIILSQGDAKTVFIKLGSAEEFYKAKTDLLYNKNFFKISDSTKSISYAVDEEKYILFITKKD